MVKRFGFWKDVCLELEESLEQTEMANLLLLIWLDMWHFFCIHVRIMILKGI